MAALEKLLIRGIRSFDDKQASVIEFYTPVTVIVGHNGSGKTTIIECLKYATTGDQPPNTKGGAFVHDPKIANEKEVKAQVKLRFMGANQNQMLAVRNLSVTVKKTGLTMKTLESLLAKYPYKPGDKRGVLSTKCAELDSEIPSLLGVSKAVLENVIFCHQEDSYWPLAEASVLKKKFDDIFEATKYTKALDAIKNLRKERVADLKTEKERLSHLQLEKSRAEKLRTKIQELTQSISRMEADEEELAAEVRRVDQENILYVATATQFNQTYTIVEGLETRIEEIKKDITEQERTTQEVTDSDEELEAKILNHNKHKSTLEREGLRVKAALNEERPRLDEERENLNKTTRLLGQLQAEAKAHEEKIQARENLVRSLASKHGLKGYDHSPLEEDRVSEFELKLKDIHHRKTTEYEKLAASGTAKIDSMSKQLVDLTSQQTQYKMERGNIRQSIGKLQEKISADENRVDGNSMIHTELKYSESELQSTRTRLEAAKAAYLTANHDAAIKAKAHEREQLDAQKNTLNANLRGLALQSDSRARLGIKKAEVAKKKNEIDVILEANSPRLLELAGVEAQASTMETDVDKALAEKEKAATQADQKAARVNANLAQIENSISTTTQQLRKKRDEIKALTTEIAPFLQPEDHDPVETVAAAISIVQADADRNKDDHTALSTSRGFFETYLKQGLKGGKVCKMCDHKMSAKEWDDFEKKMAKRLEKSSQDHLDALQSDIRWCEEQVRSLQALLPKEGTRDRMKTVEVPALEKQLASEEAKLDAESKLAESANEEAKAMKSQLRELRTLQTYASTVTRTQKELERLYKEIKELELSLASSGSTETTDDLQVKLDGIDAKIKTADRERSNLEASRDHELALQRTMQNEIHSLEMRHQELQTKAKERERLQQTIADHRAEIEAHLARVKELDTLVQNSEEPLARLNYEIEEYKRKHEAELRVIGKALGEFQHSRDALEQHNEAIESYIKNRRARELKKCEDRLAELERGIVELEEIIRQRSEELAAVNKEEHEGGATYARYTDNLRLRKLRTKLVQLQTEVAGYDMEEAARAKRNFQTKYPKMQARLEDLKDRRARLGGELSTQKAHLEGYENDLTTDFNDINKRYTAQLVQVKISDMANSDLEKYAKALDNAIMKYHSLKMEEVNETMRHLWNKTYQGTDIDGIKIRSDNDGATSTRRTYNYRVVMTKDQVEMDMRGRCSAGQKMLASIIIRLALSDSFGQNCGILALDEPTNALDSENIDALAESLVDIIKERKAMSNFQLIVITHDEKFLQKLGQADVMEYYWRVMRDRSQKSVIERHRFGVDAS